MAAPSVVQSAIVAADSLTTLAFGSNVVSGNLLIVCAGYENAGNIPIAVPTDSQSNSYTRLVDAGKATINASIYYAVAGSSAACTVTSGNTDTNNLGLMGILEVQSWSGNTADVGYVIAEDTVEQEGTTSTLAIGARSNAEDLLIAFTRFSPNGTVSSTGSGWATTAPGYRESESTRSGAITSRQTADTNDYEPSFSYGSSSFIWQVAIAIKGAAGGGGVVGPLLRGHLSHGGILRRGRLARC